MSNSAKFINIWIFVFPEKENTNDWETSTEKPVQIVVMSPSREFPAQAELWKFRAKPSWGTLISELKPS